MQHRIRMDRTLAIRALFYALRAQFRVQDWPAIVSLFFFTPEHSFRFRRLRFEYPVATDFRYIFYEVFIREVYFHRASRPIEYIVDIGANVGVSALYFGQKHKNCRIWCVEPSKRSFDFLQRNVRVNGLEGVTLIHKAISDVSGASIAFYESQAAPGHSSICAGRAEEPVVLQVETLSLADLLADLPRVDLLKMDVEGAENLVFTPGLDLSRVGTLFIEYHNFATIGHRNLPGLLHMLEASGFRYSLEARFDPRFFPVAYQDILIYAYRQDADR